MLNLIPLSTSDFLIILGMLTIVICILIFTTYKLYKSIKELKIVIKDVNETKSIDHETIKIKLQKCINRCTGIYEDLISYLDEQTVKNIVNRNEQIYELLLKNEDILNEILSVIHEKGIDPEKLQMHSELLAKISNLLIAKEKT